MDRRKGLSADNGLNTELLQCQLALFEALYKGTGIKGILAVAEQYYNCPVFVSDTSYNIISYSPSGSDFYGLKYNKGKAYLDSIEIESMKRYKVIENIYSHATAFCSHTPDHPTDHWVFCAIRIQTVVAGYIGVCFQKKEPSQDDLSLTTITAQVLSIEMQKHEVFVTKSGLKYEYFLIDLLEGHFDDIETLQSRIQLLDRKLHKYLCILTISCSHTYDPTLFNKKQMDHLRAIYPDSMSLVYKNDIVLLISQKAPIVLNGEKEQILFDFMSRNHVKAGISQIFMDPLESGAYYKQSLKTLEIGKTHFPDQLLFNASEMILFNLLHNCEYSELKSCIPFHITELLQFDVDNNLELTDTLKAYLNHNRNAASTAEYLHIHRSTLFYRLKKIEDLLSITMNDSKILFLFQLSFAIQDYIKSENIASSRTHNSQAL